MYELYKEILIKTQRKETLEIQEPDELTLNSILESMKDFNLETLINLIENQNHTIVDFLLDDKFIDEAISMTYEKDINNLIYFFGLMAKFNTKNFKFPESVYIFFEECSENQSVNLETWCDSFYNIVENQNINMSYFMDNKIKDYIFSPENEYEIIKLKFITRIFNDVNFQMYTEDSEMFKFLVEAYNYVINMLGQEHLSIYSMKTLKASINVKNSIIYDLNFENIEFITEIISDKIDDQEYFIVSIEFLREIGMMGYKYAEKLVDFSMHLIDAFGKNETYALYITRFIVDIGKFIIEIPQIIDLCIELFDTYITNKDLLSVIVKKAFVKYLLWLTRSLSDEIFINILENTVEEIFDILFNVFECDDEICIIVINVFIYIIRTALEYNMEISLDSEEFDVILNFDTDDDDIKERVSILNLCIEEYLCEEYESS